MSAKLSVLVCVCVCKHVRETVAAAEKTVVEIMFTSVLRVSAENE